MLEDGCCDYTEGICPKDCPCLFCDKDCNKCELDLKNCAIDIEKTTINKESLSDKLNRLFHPIGIELFYIANDFQHSWNFDVKELKKKSEEIKSLVGKIESIFVELE